jgi:hypothetical protein
MKCQYPNCPGEGTFTGVSQPYGPHESDAENTLENLPGGFAYLCDDHFGLVTLDTHDLQNDLALMQTDDAVVKPADLIQDYTNELKRRSEKLPTNCRLVYDPYGRFKQRLVYDLE